MYHILLIDDDAELAGLLGDYLQQDGFAVSLAENGENGLATLQGQHVDAVVLDYMLPGQSGIDVLRQLRQLGNTPVLMLTARGDDMDRILGLELGADDYVAKPCQPRELAARLRAILRRSGAEISRSSIHAGLLSVHPGQRRVEWQGVAVELTSTEFKLIEALAREAGRIVSKENLSLQALGRPLVRFDRSIDVHMSSIRRKLGPLPDGRSCIQTVFRQGYQLLTG